MNKFITALLIDRNGFKKMIEVRFDEVIHIPDIKPIAVEITIKEPMTVSSTAEVREFYFEDWIKGCENEFGIWREY